MSLTNVWLQTLGDGLVRADQVVGIDVHQTPALTGKAPHWLVDAILPASIGSGARGEWNVSVLHRTLVQTSTDPGDAAAVLARLLAQLGAVNAAGIVTASRVRDAARSSKGDEAAAGLSMPEGEATTGSTSIRFRFVPFPSPPPGHHTGAEYL